MFPANLDGAKVLYYTQNGNYGELKLLNGETVDKYSYLAICKYENDEDYYLFCCNKNYEVVNDTVWESIEKCMSIASSSYNEKIEWVNYYG